MARLTSFSRLLIALVIVAGVFFAVRKFLSMGASTAEPAKTETPGASANEAAESTAPPSGSQTTPSASRVPFNFTAPEPVNGRLKGVVELGSTGFNSFIIRVDAQKNWKLEKAEFGASLVYEKLTTDEDVKKGLRQYIADMLAYGVGAKDIHFVISSGAKKVDVTQKIMETLKGMGYYVNTVTPEQEAKLAYKAAMAKGFESRAFVVDIGSGNTKIAWMQSGQINGLETYGAKYYQNSTPDNSVYQDAMSKAKQVPGFARQTCFVIGGVPYELAKKLRNGSERYTVLNAPQDYKADGEKQKAGLNIYKAVADATGCKQFVFDWDANFTIGFLLNL